MIEPTEYRVIELVAEVLHHDKSGINVNSRFVEDLEANSLDVVELACMAEEEFGILIPESKIATIRTVSDVIKILSEPKQP